MCLGKNRHVYSIRIPLRSIYKQSGPKKYKLFNNLKLGLHCLLRFVVVTESGAVLFCVNTQLLHFKKISPKGPEPSWHHDCNNQLNELCLETGARWFLLFSILMKCSTPVLDLRMICLSNIRVSRHHTPHAFETIIMTPGSPKLSDEELRDADSKKPGSQTTV